MAVEVAVAVGIFSRVVMVDIEVVGSGQESDAPSGTVQRQELERWEVLVLMERGGSQVEMIGAVSLLVESHLIRHYQQGYHLMQPLKKKGLDTMDSIRDYIL